MRKSALTAAAIERLKLPAKGQTEYFDAGYPGLACRVSMGGAKSFVYLYRMHGKPRRMTLGRWPAMTLKEAREAWREARKTIDRGEDPKAKKPTNEFVAVVDEWLTRDQGGNRSIYDVERLINKDVKPAWKGRSISDLGRRDCLAVIDAIADRGAVTMARRAHSYLHRLFEWAVGRRIIDANPMAGLPKPGAEVQRDRVLSDDELAQVWQASKSLGYPFGPAVQLLIMTGARLGEVSALRWSEVKDGKIVLTETKNGKPHVIPMSEPVRNILAELPRLNECEFAFSTTGRTPVSGWSKAKRHIDSRVPDIPPWRFHDFRRTVATGMQRLGIGLQVVEAVLGHISGSRAGVVGIYQRHEYLDEKRHALALWAAHIETLLTGEMLRIAPLSP